MSERIKGVYKATDYADEVYEDFKNGIPGGESCGWSNLQPFYSVKLGQLSIITGIANHGKSTFIDNLHINLATRSGWKFVICSPENQPIQRHVESLIEIKCGKKFSREGGFAITPEEMADSLAFIDEHFVFINPDETDFHMEYILALAEEIKKEFDFQGMVIDPYNEMEHKRPDGYTETQYIAHILGKYRRSCRKHNYHGWMVAHPTKLREIGMITSEVDAKKHKIYAMPSMYDISGGANWNNKADMGVIVYRDMTATPNKTIISVQKVRFRECGKRGDAEFYYDFINNRLVENHIELSFRG